jgi:hypothetical protein
MMDAAVMAEPEPEPETARTPRYSPAYPGAEVLRAEEPRVCVFHSFFSGAECAHIVELARPKFKRAGVVGKGTAEGQKKLTSGRTNSSAWLDHDATPALWATTQRVAAAVGWPSARAEKWQVIRYELDQEYRRHFDGFCPEHTTDFHGCTAESGNRLLTALGCTPAARARLVHNRAATHTQFRVRMVLLLGCEAGTARA